jgi:hypothetical protein
LEWGNWLLERAFSPHFLGGLERFGAWVTLYSRRMGDSFFNGYSLSISSRRDWGNVERSAAFCRAFQACGVVVENGFLFSTTTPQAVFP